MSYDNIDSYITDHIDKQSDLLTKLHRDTQIKTLHGRMVSGHLQGRILKMLCRMVSAKRILELGTFTGFSAISMAEALPIDGELHTIEIDDEMEDLARKYIEASPQAKQIKLHIGDAITLIPQLQGEFDLVFIDADKRLYSQYYDLVINRIPIGGVIVADNTLWDGKVLQNPHPTDAQTIGIQQFNDHITADTRIEKVILPVRDGLTIIYKIKG